MTFRSKILLFGLACLLGTASLTSAFAKSRHHSEDDTQTDSASSGDSGSDSSDADNSDQSLFSSSDQSIPAPHRHHKWHPSDQTDSFQSDSSGSDSADPGAFSAPEPPAPPKPRPYTPHLHVLSLIHIVSASSKGRKSQGLEGAQCRAQGGDYLTGTIVSGPFFVSARKSQRGVALSHTQIILRAPSGRTYDIRADNVFADGYDQAGPNQVPAPLSTLSPGDQLSLCGRVYRTRAGGMGMDWVHTNCGNPPDRHAPDGWLEQVSPAMTNSPNLEGSEEYCHLW